MRSAPRAGIRRRNHFRLTCYLQQENGPKSNDSHKSPQTQALTGDSPNTKSEADGNLAFHSGFEGENPDDLAEVAAAWPGLPADVKRNILYVVRSYTPGNGPSAART